MKCGVQTFDCHEFVLSARSPVFRAMFQHDMAEKQSKVVEIQTLHSDVVAEMLQYIYTGKKLCLMKSSKV